MLLSVATTVQQRSFTKSVSVNYATKQVTFNISWAAGSRGTSGASTYNSKVWVLVDYQEVRNNAPYGSWQRANIDLTKLPANCTADGTNTKGFWYQGQTSAAQNANITITLTDVPTQFKWCAFASDCPPNVVANNGGVYTFRGTPPFTLTAVNGTTKQIVNEKTATATALSIIPKTITDATGCSNSFCPYTGNDLLLDASHTCLQRTSDAKNWEAWIKDARDNKIYRIVLMPDNKWWMAQNLDYRKGNYLCAYDKESYCGKYGTMIYIYDAIPTSHCPSGWRLPEQAELYAIAYNAAAVYKLRATTSWIGDSNSTSYKGTDDYGLTILATGFRDYMQPLRTDYGQEGLLSYLIR